MTIGGVMFKKHEEMLLSFKKVSISNLFLFQFSKNDIIQFTQHNPSAIKYEEKEEE